MFDSVSNLTVPVAAQTKERHVLAERYKTKTCRNYLATGACPYETRCMFAHGDHELRTTDMNLRDGLITEEAIKAFQRAMSLKARAAAAAVVVAAPPAYDTTSTTPAASYEACQCEDCLRMYRHNPYSFTGYIYEANPACPCPDCLAVFGAANSNKADPTVPLEP